MIILKTSYSNRKWFDNQKQVAEFLCIKNSSKKSIESNSNQNLFLIQALRAIFDKTVALLHQHHMMHS